MYNFEISKKGWLVTHSNESQVRINLNNVTRIQTWISHFDSPVTGSGYSYNLSLELSSDAKVEKLAKGTLDNEKYEQSFWGFGNVFTFIYLNGDTLNAAIEKIDKYLNS